MVRYYQQRIHGVRIIINNNFYYSMKIIDIYIYIISVIVLYLKKLELFKTITNKTDIRIRRILYTVRRIVYGV